MSKSLFSSFRGGIERKTTGTGILMWSKKAKFDLTKKRPDWVKGSVSVKQCVS